MFRVCVRGVRGVQGVSGCSEGGRNWILDEIGFLMKSDNFIPILKPFWLKPL